MNMLTWQGIGSVSLLAISSVFDIRTKKVPLYVLAAGTLPAIVFLCRRMMQNTENGWGGNVMDIVWCLLPGLFLLLLSRITEEKIGAGDGLLLLLLGVMEGGRMAGLVFCWGIFLQSVFAVGLVICKKAGKQTQIPFVPFLLLGRLVLYVI